MNYPLVSIIIPTYNRAHLIGETLDSVLAQTYTNWECIIVDDGSDDNTAEVVGKYVMRDARFQYHHRSNDYPKGGNACRNYGFELSKGEYVNWFDDDDVMHPEFINAKIKFLDENNYKVIICSGYFVDNNLNTLREMNYYDEKNLFRSYTMYKSEILTPSVLIKKDYLEKHNLFNLKLSRGQETEFFHRLFFKLSCTDYKYTTDKLFYYRQHNQTITNKNKKVYNVENRFSQAYTTIENIKRGFILKDEEIINHMHKFSLFLLFSALKFKDIKTMNYIIENYKEVYLGINKRIFFCVKLYIKLFFKFNFSSNIIENKIKKVKLKSF